MEKTASINKMLRLANRLNEIVEEMKSRRDALLSEQRHSKKAA